MRKYNLDIEKVKKAVSSAKGIPVKVRYNKGRKCISIFDGVIVEAYQTVFIVSTHDKVMPRLSLTYADILTGDVKFKRL